MMEEQDLDKITGMDRRIFLWDLSLFVGGILTAPTIAKAEQGLSNPVTSTTQNPALEDITKTFESDPGKAFQMQETQEVWDEKTYFCTYGDLGLKEKNKLLTIQFEYYLLIGPVEVENPRTKEVMKINKVVSIAREKPERLDELAAKVDNLNQEKFKAFGYSGDTLHIIKVPVIAKVMPTKEYNTWLASLYRKEPLSAYMVQSGFPNLKKMPNFDVPQEARDKGFKMAMPCYHILVDPNGKALDVRYEGNLGQLNEPERIVGEALLKALRLVEYEPSSKGKYSVGRFCMRISA